MISYCGKRFCGSPKFFFILVQEKRGIAKNEQGEV